MKKILFPLTLLLFVIESFGQTEASRTASKDYYLQKSKNQKTVGWVMLGGGVAMATVGLIITSKHVNDDPFEALSNLGTSGGAVILTIAGIGSALGSIPFFISSSKNARRAAAISFKYKNLLLQQQSTFILKRQPVLTLKIAL